MANDTNDYDPQDWDELAHDAERDAETPAQALPVDGTDLVSLEEAQPDIDALAVDTVVEAAAVEPPPQALLPAFELTAQRTTTLQERAGLVVAKTICVNVERSKFGNTRKASTDAVTVKSDKALLSLTKRLLASEELDAIGKLDSKIAKELKVRALPSKFKGGIHLIPIGLVREIHDMLTGFAAERAALVATAVEKYPQRVEETKARLDVLGDAGDYPTTQEFAESFALTWEFVTFDTPARLREIDLAIFQDAQERATARLSVVANECEQAMRAGMVGLVNRMVERLTPNEDGTPKVFKRSMVDNMNEFLRTFEMRNATDDAQLAQLVQRAREVMAGVDPKGLRQNEALRDAVAGQFQQLQQAMAGFVVEGQTRAIAIDDDEGEGDE